ncbi:glycosyltransferase family 2 protein [Paraburkholderia adhaesiva]|uniref:glycosyltransferase family 2 protein n=1 Tax=Paraburkholderia adhaesiva TaxID=2883244 RepID=UPI001F39D464|nr:glycosyltransferase family 2 protein [Paraburkholderia adhaesiva]
MELTILMPCLNEIETLATCIEKAKAFLMRNGIDGEVLIADNGSEDGSVDLAHAHGARVVHVPRRGYGAALLHGIKAAQGKFVIMGDSDDSYDFSELDAFIERLRDGVDLVMGNRFRGGIAEGAMPPLHRYLGNPVLSFIGRLFFSIPVRDFHCGLRGLNRDRFVALGLTTTGMEFASEMIVRAALSGYTIDEVPTTLSKDGRSRPPHLRTWHDGWRHLRFLLIFSPRWLFFYPGLIFLAFGSLVTLAALPGPIEVAPGVSLDVHSVVAGCMTMLIGTQCMSFAIVARRYAAFRGFLSNTYTFKRFTTAFTLERALFLAGVLILGGVIGVGFCLLSWARVNLGALPYGSLIRTLVTSGAAIAIGLQIAFTAFLSEVLEIESAPN